MTERTYSILKKLEKKPGMYLGKPTLKAFSDFLRGYDTALKDLEVSENFFPSYDFYQFVACKLDFSESAVSWDDMILAFSMGFDPKESIQWETYFNGATKEQHYESINLFYKLVHEYLRTNLEK